MTLDLFRQCGIICFSIGLWNCSVIVALFVFVLKFGTVKQIIPFFRNSSKVTKKNRKSYTVGTVPKFNRETNNSTLSGQFQSPMASFVYLLDFGNVRQYGIICFSIGLWNISDSVH
jgi:hypothetical protein